MDALGGILFVWLALTLFMGFAEGLAYRTAYDDGVRSILGVVVRVSPTYWLMRLLTHDWRR